MRTLIAAICLLITFPAPALAQGVHTAGDDGKRVDGEYVSSIDDDNIKESSGLAYSSKFSDLAYTINDENGPIYTIRPSTGKVVGTIKLDGVKLGDPESLYVDPYGHIWLGDLGDNDEERDDAAIYAFNEPGAGKFEVKQTLKFPVNFDDGPTNVEAMLVNPISGQVYLIRKVKDKKKDGSIFALPNPLENGQTNRARKLDTKMPPWVTDGEITPDGARALVKTEDEIFVYDPESWELLDHFKTRKIGQSESLTIEPDQKNVLIGAEGKGSPLLRIPLPADARPTSTATPTESALSNLEDFEPVPVGSSESPVGVSLKSLVGLVIILGLVVGMASLVWLRVGLRRRRKLNRIRRT
jgi:hypothetical protein